MESLIVFEEDCTDLAEDYDYGEEEYVEPEYRYVNCDRPFVYAIVDGKTMTPVFIGTVNSVN